MKRNLNLSVDISTYQEVKRTIPEGKVSPLVDSLLRKYFKEQKQERLIASYKRSAQSKALKKEDEI
jgi:hypothetical protein